MFRIVSVSENTCGTNARNVTKREIQFQMIKKTFDTVKEGTILFLKGKFIKEDKAVIAKVTLTETHGNSIRITYRALCENPFTHTITVDKFSDSHRTMIHNHEWTNWYWEHLLWLKKWNSLSHPIEYYASTIESRREFRKLSELRYDYTVTII